jgi:hypothetical protein
MNTILFQQKKNLDREIEKNTRNSTNKQRRNISRNREQNNKKEHKHIFCFKLIKYKDLYRKRKNEMYNKKNLMLFLHTFICYTTIFSFHWFTNIRINQLRSPGKLDHEHLVFSVPIPGHYFTYSNDHSIPNSQSHLPIFLFFQLRSPVKNGLGTPVTLLLRQKIISEHPDTCPEFGMT